MPAKLGRRCAGTFLRWNGLAWKGQPFPGVVLNDVDMVTASDGWAVGTGGAIFHYDGSNWSQVPAPRRRL